MTFSSTTEDGFLLELGGTARSTLGQPAAVITVDLSLYELAAVERACYKLTGRCWIELRKPAATAASVEIALHPKDGKTEIREWVGELFNELLDQQIRERLAREVGPLRELIVAQAFAEGNLLDRDRDEGDIDLDSNNIATRQRHS